MQTYDPAPRDEWCHAWLRDLSNKGTYEGIDSLFAETSPSCSKCGRSLGPENVVGHSELDEAAELLSRLG